MSKIVQMFTDQSKTEQSFPKTVSDAVYRKDGQTTVEDSLEELSKMENKLNAKFDSVDIVNGRLVFYINGEVANVLKLNTGDEIVNTHSYIFNCSPQSGTGLVSATFSFDTIESTINDTYSLSMDIQPISNVSGIKNGIFAVNDTSFVTDLTNNIAITQKCWVNNTDDSLISLTPTIPTITKNGRYVHIGIKLGATDKSSKVQFKISNIQFKVNNNQIKISDYGISDKLSGDTIVIE